MKNAKIVDFHAHILPGADHGSRNIETTVKQLELYSGFGVEKVVATPHFYPEKDSVESFLKRREGAVELLKGKMQDDYPLIYVGAEVLVCPGISEMPDLEKLCIMGTNVILLEMPFSGWNDEHIKSVSEISRNGYISVMAHIDRYPMKDIVRLYEECDVQYQLNGESVCSFSGIKKARKLCSNLPVAALGSDIHGEDKKALKNLMKLYKRIGGETADRAAELLKYAIPLQNIINEEKCKELL